jgi:hypothetical protein
MAMTDTDRILAYLRSLSPKAATNSEMQEATGTEIHQGVHQLTQDCSTDVNDRACAKRFRDERR